MPSHPSARAVLCLVLFLAIAPGVPTGVRAQGLDWEGRTGAMMTPFAWTAGSVDGGAGRVAAAFHMLSAGNVVGTHFQLSATVGLGSRLEAGVTRSAVTVEETEAVSSLFDRGFTSQHANSSAWPATRRCGRRAPSRPVACSCPAASSRAPSGRSNPAIWMDFHGRKSPRR